MWDRKAGPDAEAERIRRTYDRCRSPASHAARHAGGNPGRQAITAERHRLVADLLRELGLASPRGRRVLDVGCGYGHELARMEAHGARPEDMAGPQLRFPRALEVPRP